MTYAEELLALSAHGPQNEAAEKAMISLRVVGDRLHLESPYNKAQVPELGKAGMGGKWSRKLKEWSFPLKQYEEVAASYDSHFGTHGVRRGDTGSLSVELNAYEMTALQAKGVVPPLYQNDGETITVRIAGVVLATMAVSGGAPELASGVKLDRGGLLRRGDDDDAPYIALLNKTVLVAEDIAPLGVLLKRVAALLNQTSEDTGIKLFGAGTSDVETKGAGGASDIPVPADVSSSIEAMTDDQKRQLEEFDRLLDAIGHTIDASTVPLESIRASLAKAGITLNA